MGGTSLILADALFVAVLISTLVTGSLTANAIILVPMLIMAFASCTITHIKHYHDTGRFY